MPLDNKTWESTKSISSRFEARAGKFMGCNNDIFPVSLHFSSEIDSPNVAQIFSPSKTIIFHRHKKKATFLNG